MDRTTPNPLTWTETETPAPVERRCVLRVYHGTLYRDATPADLARLGYHRDGDGTADLAEARKVVEAAKVLTDSWGARPFTSLGGKLWDAVQALATPPAKDSAKGSAGSADAATREDVDGGTQTEAVTTPAQPAEPEAPTCTRRALLDTDEDEPTGPMCGKPATHRVCDPAGAPVCAEHRCRCDMALKPIDPRPTCARCGKKWTPPEGLDATVWPCEVCAVESWGDPPTPPPSDLAAKVLAAFPRCYHYSGSRSDGPCGKPATHEDNGTMRCRAHVIEGHGYSFAPVPWLAALEAAESAQGGKP